MIRNFLSHLQRLLSWNYVFSRFNLTTATFSVSLKKWTDNKIQNLYLKDYR